jgi:WD40 repeat protein
MPDTLISMSDMFISYSRKDKGFVHKLLARLEDYKREIWVDEDKIPLTAEWLEEVYAGIEGADTFAFVISEDSVTSEYCILELAHAVQNNKRLAPILYRPVPDKDVPRELRRHQYIPFLEGEDFEEAFQRLVRALDTDLAWAHDHTRLLVKAKEWEAHRRDNSFLLRGRDLDSAEALQAREEKLPAQETQEEWKLTDLQKDYIRASRTAATRFKQAVFAISAFILIIVALAAYAFWQRHEAAARELAGQAQLMSSQGGESLQSGVLLATEAKQRLPTSLVADEVLREGIALLARPGPDLAHQAPVYAADYSPDGKYLATAGDDGARLWDAKSGKPLGAPLKPNTNGMSNVIFSPNGKYVATASAGGSACVWEVPTGKQVAPCFKHSGVVAAVGQPDIAFSPDSKLLATTDGTKKAAYLWNIAEGHQVAQLDLPAPGQLVAFSPDGKQLATASGKVAQIWDLQSRHQVARMEHDNDIYKVTFSPDSQYLATASADGTARVWDAQSGKEVLRLRHDDVLTDLAFSPDGKRLATASKDASARVWSVRNGQQVARFDHESTVNTIDFSPDGKKLATASVDTAHVWDIATGQEVARMSHLDKIARVAFSPDGKHVATASYDHTARIWDVTGDGVTSVAHDQGSVNGVAFSPNGKYLATAGSDNTARVWDVKSGQEVRSFKHDDAVNGVTFSPNSKYIATASNDKTARLWDIATGEQVALMRHDDTVYGGIAFSRDGKELATASADGTAHVWGVPSGKELHSFHQTIYGAVYSAAFSPNGKHIATAGADGKALVWDIATGKVVGQVAPHMAHDKEIWDVAFSPDGNYIALAGMDGTVWLWDLASKTLVGEPMQHEGPVASINFSPDSKYLATASYDHTARVWGVPSTREVARLNHDYSLNGVAFSPSGDRVATAGADGTAHVEPWRPGGLVEEACSRLTRDLTEVEWQRYVGGPYELPLRTGFDKTCPRLSVLTASSTASSEYAHPPNLQVKNGGPTYSRLGGGAEQASLDSIKTSHTALSTSDGCGNKVSYEPEKVMDDEPTTAWKVGGDGAGEWIELKYDKPIEVSRVGIIPGYAKTDPCEGTDRFYQYRVVKNVKIEFSDGSSVEKSFRQRPQMQFVDVPDTKTSSVRVTIQDTYPPATNKPYYGLPYGETFETAAISEIEVEGP